MSLLDLISQSYHDIGAAKAGAAERVGQIWATAAQSLGQLPEQIQAQKTAQLQNQVTTAQLQGLQAAQASQQRASQALQGIPRNPDGTFDIGQLDDALAKANVLPEDHERLLTSFGKVNDTIKSWRQAQLDHTASIADSILSAHGPNDPVTWDAVNQGLAQAKVMGLATDAEAQQFAQLQASGADPVQVLKTIRSQGSKFSGPTKYTPLPANSGGVLNEATGQVTPTGVKAVPKTKAELAVWLADPARTPEEKAQGEAAMKSLTQPTGFTTKSVLLDGKPAEVRVNHDGQFVDDAGTVIPSARIKPIPPASGSQLVLPGNSDTVQGYIQDVLTGSKKLSDVPAAGGTRNAVVAELHKEGYDISKPLTAQTQARVEFANGVLPQVSQVADLAHQIDAAGLTGTIGGRLRRLAAGESAGAVLADLTPEQRRLVGQFTTKAGLLVSGIAMVHGGARGGGSTQMLEQLKPLLDPHNKDLQTYLGNLDAAKDILDGYAQMGQSLPKGNSAKDPLGIRKGSGD